MPKQEACSMQIHDIQALVATRMGVTVLDILSDRQTQAAVRPRHVAMWLARHTTTYSLPAIGLAFGNRDHTTVMNGIARTDERMAADPALASAVLAMRNIITSSREIAA
jgi:chromosomal replication initiator protein